VENNYISILKQLEATIFGNFYISIFEQVECIIRLGLGVQSSKWLGMIIVCHIVVETMLYIVGLFEFQNWNLIAKWQ